MAIILARKTKNSGGDKSTLPPDFSLEEMPRDLSSLSGVSEVQSSSSKQESSGVDTDSVTEEPIVPQIIVPNQDCELENVSFENSS
ncbi:hypothetical protein M8J77_004650 [Diaphorina citri]|nr:hypothetical protein M8J77_004650 [Diaphorina citri]